MEGNVGAGQYTALSTRLEQNSHEGWETVRDSTVKKEVPIGFTLFLQSV
jgi:hypothetical protein